MPELATFALFAYRQEAFVAEAIRAVARQTYRPMELIITDDASTDGTRAAIEEALRDFPSDIPVTRLFHERNQGISGVINAAVRKASGRVVIFGAGDDISASERVAHTMHAFQDPAVTFVHTAVVTIDDRGNSMDEQSPLSADAEFVLRDFLNGTCDSILGASCAYAMEIFQAFDELPRDILREDVILPMRAMFLGKGRFLSARLVHYRRHSGNLHSPAQSQSSAEMVTRNLRFADDRKATCAQLAADAKRASGRGIRLGDDFCEHLRRERAYSDLEQELLRIRWRCMRLGKIFVAWARRRIGSASAVKLVALFVMPRLYAPLLKARIQHRQRKQKMLHG